MVNNKAENVAPNIFYEFQMLDWAHCNVIAGQGVGKQHNAVLECFLIHARNLLDFFIKSNSYRNDDVIARDYFENDSYWAEIEGDICKYAKTQREDMHKKLAHISYTRTSEKKWDVYTLYSELVDAKKMFLDSLNEEQRKWFLA